MTKNSYRDIAIIRFVNGLQKYLIYEENQLMLKIQKSKGEKFLWNRWLARFQQIWGIENSIFFVKLFITPVRICLGVQVNLFACAACADAYVHHGKRLMQHVSSIIAVAYRFIYRFKIWYFSHSHTRTHCHSHRHVQSCPFHLFDCSIRYTQ